MAAPSFFASTGTPAMFDIALTQHCGKNPGQQDALLCGGKVFQERDLPVSRRAVPDGEALAVAVADGVASSPMPQKASRLVLELLADEMARGAALNAPAVRKIHGGLCDALAKGQSFGSATTIAAVSCLGDRCVAVSVGDSRVYRIDARGAWRQISRDHTVLNAMIDRGEANAQTEYASLYDMLDACLVADDEETDFPVCRAETPFLPGDALLVCTDGVHDVLGDERLRKLTRFPVDPVVQVELWRKAILRRGAPDNFSLALILRRP
jgi:serine/threonine protein phosphatase PrpC